MDGKSVVGMVFALVSAISFGASGSFARGLLEIGWSPAAAVTWRVAVGGILLLAPALVSLRGRWHLLRLGLPNIVFFGVTAIAGTQFAFYQAIAHVSVGVGILLEFLGVILVVVWLWIRHGNAPRPLTLLGSVLALIGLLLILGIFGAVEVNPLGVIWGLAAAVGLAIYFVAPGDEVHDVPPLVFSAGGLLVGATTLLAAGLIGITEITWGTGTVQLAGWTLPWWVDVGALGLVSTALSYVTGVAAIRRLGSKMASFVGLSEVMAAVVIAWLLLDEIPAPIQILGGFFIVAGVIAVKTDERHEPAPLGEVVPEVT